MSSEEPTSVPYPGGSPSDSSRFRSAVARGLRDRARLAVIAIAVLAIAVRLVGLGARVFHWDEGRVGYWILRYAETGVWEYRPIVHGPFVFHVNKHVFGLFGASDFTARLVVALIGGALPLAALLFARRLRDSETVALALFLAANPLLVYYTRFMRNDPLVASFMLFGFGFFVYAYDTRRSWALLPGAVAVALAFTAKENALLYLLTWLGALVLLVDHRLFRAAGRTYAGDGGYGASPRAVARGYAVGTGRGLWRWRWSVVGSLLLFLLVVAVFYAPRAGGSGVGLDTAFSDPTLFPAALREALVGSWSEFVGTWIEGGHQDHAYLPYLGSFLKTMVYGAGAISVFALVGFVADRYAEGSRDLVAFAFYWGFVSVLGYPIVTDIKAPWAAVNAVVPLAIPAAVGVALIYRWGRDARASDDRVSVGLAAVVLLVTAGLVGTTAVDAAYLHSADEKNEAIIQWAQPHNDMRPTIERMMAVSERHESGTDVLFFGTRNPRNPDEVLFHVVDEGSLDQAPPGGPSWHSRLPLPWYLERAGANVSSTAPSAGVGVLQEDPPPVVVAYSWNRTEVNRNLPDRYEMNRHGFKLWGEYVAVFVDQSYVEEESQGALRAPAPPASAVELRARTGRGTA